MSKKFKIIIGVLIIPIVFFAYSTFFSREDENVKKLSVANTPTQTSVATGVGSPIEGQEILRVLNSLKAVKMDTEFFDDKVFKSLVDFSVELAPQPAGRFNPFAPI
jgi:hypothetical protein